MFMDIMDTTRAGVPNTDTEDQFMFTDFADFEAWYVQRATRTHGRAPAASTLESNRYRLRSVAGLLSIESGEQLATLLSERESVESLLDQLYTKQAPITVRATLTTLRHYSAYGVAKGWTKSCAITKDDAPKHIPRKAIEVYRPEEMERILLFTLARGHHRFWMLLVTLIDTGRRINEVLSLRWEDLKLDGDPPHFDLPNTKNKRQQYVPLTTRMREEVFTPENIARCMEGSPTRYVKDVSEYPFPWQYQPAHDLLHRICDAADVPYKQGFHVFRHTKATAMLARGVPIQAVSALLGHSSVATTDRIYNHATALNYMNYVD